MPACDADINLWIARSTSDGPGEVLAVEVMHVKLHGDEPQLVLVWNDDADRNAGILDHLFGHCDHP